METLVLTDPVVVPEQVTRAYRVTAITLDLEAMLDLEGVPGSVFITLADDLDKRTYHSYTGKTATDYIKFLNTANLTTKSMHKRILERLSADGKLVGTVVGAPDPPAE